MSISLVAGLGNPGRDYELSRHNLGWLVVDAYASKHGLSWKAAPQFDSLIARRDLGPGRTVWFMKPHTFMNESGRSVAEAARFHKIALADILVLHDELDLAPGKLRIKLGGGNAGHNGLRSITAHMGNDYRRVRLGSGHPGDKALVHNYVLSDFAKAERPWVEVLCGAVAQNIALLAKGDDSLFQNKVHLAMEAAGFESQ